MEDTAEEFSEETVITSVTHENRLLLMAGLHFVVMYVLMYAMVDRIGNVLPNLNNFYMAGLMTTPMLLIEGLLMGSMYLNKRMLWAIIGVSAVLFLFFFFAIRRQFAIGNTEFLRSMIPHHAGAILMCEQASIDNSEIRELCREIIAAQESEIAQMKRILGEAD